MPQYRPNHPAKERSAATWSQGGVAARSPYRGADRQTGRTRVMTFSRALADPRPIYGRSCMADCKTHARTFGAYLLPGVFFIPANHFPLPLPHPAVQGTAVGGGS